MKIHLLDSEEPLREGQPAVAKCKAVIPHVAAAFMWDFQTMTRPPDVQQPNICSRCRKIVGRYGFSMGRNYVYGIVEERDKALLITNSEVEG